MKTKKQYTIKSTVQRWTLAIVIAIIGIALGYNGVKTALNLSVLWAAILGIGSVLAFFFCLSLAIMVSSPIDFVDEIDTPGCACKERGKCNCELQ